MRKWLAITAAFLLAGALTGCGGGGNVDNANNSQAPQNTAPAAPGGTTTTTGEDAVTIYKANCVSCHAVDLSGGVGPSLTDVGARLSTDEINATIQNGGGGMPPFKGTLSEDQIGALVNWLSTQKG